MGILGFSRNLPQLLLKALFSVLTVLVCLGAIASCSGEEWNCSSGHCRFVQDSTGCVTEQAYDQLTDEFDYINRTGDTSRIGSLYLGGRCKRFPEGTVVFVLEPGIFKVKVRFENLPDEPDRWMSAESLRSTE